MTNKTDVKAMMARFQAGGSNADETAPAPVGRPKPHLQPTFSSSVGAQTKKPVPESLSGGPKNLPPKPSLLKNTSDNAEHEPNKAKLLASRFANAQDGAATKSSLDFKQQIHLKQPPAQPPETKSPVPKPPFNKPNLSSTVPVSKPPETKGPVHQPPFNKPNLSSTVPVSKPPETKGPVHKPPFSKPNLSSTLSDSKPTFPKPVIAANSKPNWIKEDIDSAASSAPTSTPKLLLQPKPTSSLLKLWQQSEEQPSGYTDTANKPPPPPNASKPPSNFKAAQNMFNKEDKNEQSDSDELKKTPVSFTNSAPPVPLASKKPSLRKPSTSSQISSVNGDATSAPKRNRLPNSLALGSPPAKPNRPPNVNLENFKRGAEATDDGPGTFKKHIIPPHPSNHSSPETAPPQTALPSLPPGHPSRMIQQEEFYDDVEELSSGPPPLPPPSGHPSQRAQEESDDSDGEMYEDLDGRWEAEEQKQEKKREKEMKEEKKRLENERKEQREREKKDQDTRKKFKLVGPIEVIHQGNACVDCKGTKTDLALKLGESVDIIRVLGNPEGKWLGRTQDGSIGYVKIPSVKIDFNSLKSHQAQPAYEPEVYDDIDVVSSNNSGPKGPRVSLPPLPGEGGGGEIYDDVVDPNLEVSPFESRFSSMRPANFLRRFERSIRPVSTKEVPPPSLFSAKGNPEQAVDEEIYDDVDSQNAPLPPPISSMPTRCSKTEAMDSKKKKKSEKEEKDFRKKFKYDGEIQVLYQVNIVHTLTNKRWGGKELPVKAGERLDVIVEAVDSKLICRNEEGKFGYVSTCYIDTDGGDIYDDIGDDCIYDND